ncbi:hypothetical protein TNCV_4608171 [Trichonephila clavipes]|nr:hypothetical protein TNCV_4608171 [Trichonephila clavipes]
MPQQKVQCRLRLTEFKSDKHVQRRVRREWNVNSKTSKSIHQWERTLNEMGALVSQTGKVLKMEISKEKIWCISQFFFDKDENASQLAEIANGVFVADTVTVDYEQFWFRRFNSGIFDANPPSG